MLSHSPGHIVIQDFPTHSDFCFGEELLPVFERSLFHSPQKNLKHSDAHSAVFHQSFALISASIPLGASANKRVFSLKEQRGSKCLFKDQLEESSTDPIQGL